MSTFDWDAFAKRHRLSPKQLKEAQDFVVSVKKNIQMEGWWYEVVEWDDWDFGYMLFYRGELVDLTLGIFSKIRQAGDAAREAKKHFQQMNKTNT